MSRRAGRRSSWERPVLRRAVRAAGHAPIRFTTSQGRDGRWYVRHARGSRCTGDFGEGYATRGTARRAIRRHVEALIAGQLLVDGAWPL